MTRALFIVAILAVSLIAGCNGETKTDTKIGIEPVETINTRVNQEFVISRPFNASSVYMWREDHDESMLELIEGTIEVNEEGEGENATISLSQAFRFKALKRGNTHITLVLSRQTLEGSIIARQDLISVNIE